MSDALCTTARRATCNHRVVVVPEPPLPGEVRRTAWRCKCGRVTGATVEFAPGAGRERAARWGGLCAAVPGSVGP